MADVCPYEASEVCVAAGIGDLNRVKELVKENKKLLNCADYDKRSPLHIAVAEQHADIVEYLVGAGADVNITDAWGSTPLVDAMRVHNDHILAVLKKKGAKLVQNKEEMFEELCAACEVGDTPMIARYLENGVDVNGADYDSRTPMHVAAAAGHLEVVQMLLSNGSNYSPVDRWDRTPLTEALRNGHDAVVELLMDAGAAQELTNMKELQAGLSTAANDGSADTVKRLILAGVDVNAGDYDQRTALHLAAANGHLDVVQLLCSRGANVDASDRWGGTPLSEALYHRRTRVAEFLESKGAKKGSMGQASSITFSDSREVNESDESVADLEALGIAAVVAKVKEQHNAVKFVGRALQALFNLVKDEHTARECTDVQGHEVVVAVMGEHGFVSQIQKFGSGVLRTIAKTDLGAQKVVKGGGLRACVDALRDVNPDTIEYACNALSNMTFPGALDTEEACSGLIREGGVKELIHTVRQYAATDRSLLLSKAMAALWNVSGGENRNRVIAESGVQAVVDAWKQHPGCVMVTESAAGVLLTLGADALAKEHMLGSLRVGEAALDALVKFNDNREVCTLAAGLLALMAPLDGKKTISKIMMRKSGIKALCKTMQAHEESLEVHENCCRVFLVMTARTERPESMVAQFKKHGGKKSAMAAFQQFPTSPVLLDMKRHMDHLESGCVLC